MTSAWGWESPEARLKRYARVAPKRKLEALEEMRLFVVKYGIKRSRGVVKARSRSGD